MGSESRFGSREIAAIGVMGVLATVATMVFTFLIPATSGYFNFGDAIVMSTALIFGPVIGALAGGFGSGLADLLGGWYNWVSNVFHLKYHRGGAFYG